MNKKLKIYIAVAVVAIAPILIAYFVSRFLENLSLIPYVYIAVIAAIWIIWKVGAFKVK